MTKFIRYLDGTGYNLRRLAYDLEEIGLFRQRDELLRFLITHLDSVEKVDVRRSIFH